MTSQTLSLVFRPDKWQESISRDFIESDNHKHMVFSFEYEAEHDPLPLYTSDNPHEPANFSASFRIFQEYVQPTQGFLSDCDKPDPIKNLMKQSVPTPLGYAVFNSGIEDFMSGNLYVGKSLYENLQSRILFGGALPNRVDLNLGNLYLSPDHEGVFWDREKTPVLPITRFGFGTEVKVQL